jgi:hypothetical protein
MTYKMFIDDLRDPVTNDWIITRSSADALEYMHNHGCPLEISFDHDLGGDDTAMRVVKEMADMDMDTPGFIPEDFTFSVHSANPVGARNLRGFLECYLSQRSREAASITPIPHISPPRKKSTTCSWNP